MSDVICSSTELLLTLVLLIFSWIKALNIISIRSWLTNRATRSLYRRKRGYNKKNRWMHLNEAYIFYPFWFFYWFSCCLTRLQILVTYLYETEIIQLVFCADIKYVRDQVKVVHEDRICLVTGLLILIDLRTATGLYFHPNLLFLSFCSYYLSFWSWIVLFHVKAALIALIHKKGLLKCRGMRKTLVFFMW